MKTHRFVLITSLILLMHVNGASGEVAGYFHSSDELSPDIVLGSEDGILASDPDYIHGDMTIISNDEFWIQLDADDNSGSEFRVINGEGDVVHRITEQGEKSAILRTASYGQRAVYSLESPEIWLEDFGSGSLLDGSAEIAFEPVFAETVNRNPDFHVFLTPVCQEPAILFVTGKTTTGFSVRGVTLEGRPASCDFDYRITAKRLGLEDVRLQEIKGVRRQQSAEDR